MENFDWREPIKMNLFVLRCLGLWPTENYKFDFYTVYALVAVIVVIGGHNISQIINLFFVYKDLEALTGIIFLATTNLLAATKMYFFVRNIGMIKELFLVLQSDLFRPRTLEQIDIIGPILKNWKKTYLCYLTIVCVNVSMWSLSPFLDDGIKDYQLPFDSWYPLEAKKSPNYEILYTYQLICIWGITMANLHLDTIIFAIMMYVSAQCEILCNDLKNLKDDEFYNHNLIGCIKHHKAIIRFAKNSNDFFSLIALGQMATSTAVLAMTMFQLTLVSPASGEGLGHLLYIAGITTQIYLYCSSGNKVETKSGDILGAVYESQWFGQPQEVKKTLLIFCMRCQRPIKMTAINLFILSLEAFIKILRSAYSYFAVLYSAET